MDITHDNVCSSMLSCFYSHLLSTGRPISSIVYNTLREKNPLISSRKHFSPSFGWSVGHNYMIKG